VDLWLWLPGSFWRSGEVWTIIKPGSPWRWLKTMRRRRERSEPEALVILSRSGLSQAGVGTDRKVIYVQ